MSQQVLVRGSYRTWWMHLLTAVGLALLCLALVFAIQRVPFSLATTIVGGVILLGVELLWWSMVRQMRWVKDTGSGFIVIDSQGSVEYRDEQITSINRYVKEKYSSGMLQSVRRYFIVWIDGQFEPIQMQNMIPVEQQDPLERLIERVTERVRTRAEDSLERGARIEGDTWRLDRWGISLRVGEAPREIPIDQLTAVDVFDEHLCLWKKGQDNAIAKIPLDSRNAYLLQLLLEPRIPEQEALSPQAPREGLGRILFQRKNTRFVVPLSLLAAFILPMGLMFIWLMSDEMLWSGVVMSALGAGAALVALYYDKLIFRCHEYGIYREGLLSEHQLRFDEVATFTYQVERQFFRSEYTLYKGIYTGTRVALRFEPSVKTGIKPIAFSTTIKKVDEDLEGLKDKISSIIAATMADQLAEGQVIQWTPKLTIHSLGLEYRPTRFLGQRETVMRSWDEITGLSIDEGTFQLWAAGSDKAVVEENASQPNFYPGYFLLLSLLESQRDESAL